MLPTPFCDTIYFEYLGSATKPTTGIERGGNMSKIDNTPRWNNFFLKGVRGTLEHRATWLYLLLKEAEKKGIPWEDIGPAAVRACGHLHGKELVPDEFPLDDEKTYELFQRGEPLGYSNMNLRGCRSISRP